MRSLSKGHAAPASGSALEAERKAVEGRMAGAIDVLMQSAPKVVRDKNKELVSTDGARAYDELAHSQMEQEVVHMTAGMLHGGEHAVGVMTSGGTESILLAMFAYRERARKLYPHIPISP